MSPAATQERNPTSSDRVEVSLPESQRSRAAESRVLPHLRSALKARRLAYGAPVFLRIFKESRELELWVQQDTQYARFRTYPICAMSGDLGPKTKQGDQQAPEGFYQVTPVRLNPFSDYHLPFNLGYPNAYDRAHGRTGGALMVHGDCVSIGCFAMTDAGIEEIYTLVAIALRNGQVQVPVEIYPFRMTDEAMRRHRDSHWREFWEGLKPAYDHFEKHHWPATIRVEDGCYVVHPSTRP
jgi:murein L,D-transpeptidase YafK